MSRLARLCAIRDRALTEDEQAEVMYLAKLERDKVRKQERYRTDPDYRQRAIERSRDSKRRLAALRGHW